MDVAADPIVEVFLSVVVDGDVDVNVAADIDVDIDVNGDFDGEDVDDSQDQAPNSRALVACTVKRRVCQTPRATAPLDTSVS